MLSFEQIVLEVTEACPNACLHCYNYWRDDRAPLRSSGTLTRDEIRAIIRNIRADSRLKHVGISGGEPLLRRDLPGIVSDLNDEGLGVLVITGGGSLTEAVLSRFPRETAFEMTLFSSDAALHDRVAGRAGAFARLIKAALLVTGRGHPLAISVVANRLNAHRTGDALRLGLALGGNAFLFNRMNLTRATLPHAGELAPTPEQLSAALDQAEEFARECHTTISVSVPIPPCVVDLTRYRHLFFGWCARGGADSYYTVGYNGLLRPCNHSSQILGDLRTHSFRELVRSRRTRSFWRPVPARCRQCELPDAHLCRGGCPAAADECYGTRSRPDPVVDVMLRPGAVSVV